MDTSYASSYADLARRHWWWRARNRFVFEALARRCPEEGSFGEILDVGCGDGVVLEQLQRYGNVRGVEPDAAIVSEASRQRWNIHLGPLDDSVGEPSTFGLVTMLDVLEHIPDRPSALEHIRRIMLPGGLLVITVPALMALWTRHDEVNHHFTRYSRGELRREMEEAGLVVEKLHYLFHWLTPVKLLVRLAEGLGRQNSSIPTTPNAFVNSALAAISRGEQALGLHRLAPFGTSLFGVARKPEV